MWTDFLNSKETLFLLISISCIIFLILWMIYFILFLRRKNALKQLEQQVLENNMKAHLKEQELIEQKDTVFSLQNQNLELIKENERLKSEREIEAKYLREQLDFVEKSKNEMSLQFKDISRGVIETQNQHFTENQKAALDVLLKPFHDKLLDLTSKIDKSHDDSTKIDEQIKNLLNLNQTLSKDAEDLTNALKGNKKIQGNWGEFQLEHVLEISGLENGINYFKQETFKGDENQILRPDVIIKLPNDRDVIVDSKVSLNDYIAYVNAEDIEERKAALKRHISALKKHIDELSAKEYQKLLKDNTLDYVMIFVPIEGAYFEAVREDTSLYDYAVKKNIAITTPSSLLPLLRTIENLWQIEKRNKNVAEIAEIGGSLYDKLAGFIEDMDRINKSLDIAKKNYDTAISKLSTGKGNALSLADRLKKKGAKVSKQITMEYENNIPQLTEIVSNDE